VVNYVLTRGIIGFVWYQDPKLVKAAFQWNASLLEKPTGFVIVAVRHKRPRLGAHGKRLVESRSVRRID
jgi:hypothetical protein